MKQKKIQGEQSGETWQRLRITQPKVKEKGKEKVKRTLFSGEEGRWLPTPQ